MATQAGNLPIELSSFVGRSEEIEQLAALALKSRLLTLTGPGGVGKTRLAIQVARRLATEFAGGAWLVELAPLSDDALLPQAIAGALEVPDQPGRPVMDAIADYLDAHDLLLILDNCEHIVAACAAGIERLLKSCCRGLRVLATSREPLDVSGEVVWRVPSLSLPPLEDAGHGSMAAQESEAVRLFVERAGTIAPGFSLEPGNAAAVAQICRRLDGMPLALELAAARVAILTPGQIAQRLDDRFNLLSKNVRGAPSRHKTLAAAIEWSYALLSPEEEMVLRRLSVFAGSCAPDGAEAVCAGEEIRSETVLDILSRLVGKSLLVSATRNHTQGTRYHLLETVRQYTDARLRQAGELEATRERHLAYCIRLAEQAVPQLSQAGVVKWIDRLEAEHDNFREALRWSLDRGKTGADAARQSLKLAALLAPFWHLRSHISEGGAWLRDVLEQELAQEPSLDRARALRGAAYMPDPPGDEFQSLARIDECRRISEMLGPEGLVELLGALAHSVGIYSGLGRARESRVFLRRAVDLAQGIGYERGLAAALWTNSEVLEELGVPAVRELYARALALYRADGDHPNMGFVLGNMGRLSSATGDFGDAEKLYLEALTIYELIGFNPGFSGVLYQLGRTNRLQGNLGRAEAYFERAMSLGRKYGWPMTPEIIQLGFLALARGDARKAVVLFERGVTESPSRGFRHTLIFASLIGVAQAYLLVGKPAGAARIVGVMDGLKDQTSTGPDLDELPDYERLTSGVHSSLHPAALEAAMADGRTMDPLDAIAAAVSELAGDAPVLAVTTPLQAAKAQWDGLTARERDVAALVALGRSNREIAEKLIVSERTVDAHVGNILSKLEFRSRAQIAAWAVSKGLAKFTPP